MSDNLTLKAEALPPIPVMIWCIDRPAICHNIRTHCLPVSLSTDNSLISGISIVDWRSLDFDSERAIIASPEDDLNKLRLANYPEHVYPWICNHPGVWIEWKNNRFTEVVWPAS